MSSKRVIEVIIVSVIVFILFVMGVVYITKNIADLTNENRNNLLNKVIVDIDKIVNDIKEENKDLRLAYESIKLDDIKSLVYESDNKYKSIIIDLKVKKNLKVKKANY